MCGFLSSRRAESHCEVRVSSKTVAKTICDAMMRWMKEAKENAGVREPLRIPYNFTLWNSPLAQREIWGAPKLYEWQEHILRYFSENLNSHAVVSTPNESGKTSVVVPLLGLSCMAAFPGATVYSTAGAEAQIKLQLFEYLRSFCKPFEKSGWEVNQSQLTVLAPSVDGMPRSRWVGRVPRDALTAEGFHSTFEKDEKGRWRFRPLFFIADEAKSLDDPVFEMAYRLRPTWFLALSTPDTSSGPFYRAVGPEEVEVRGVARRGYRYIEDASNYWGLRMMVSADGCEHLLTSEKVREADAVRRQMGENHRLYRSMVQGKFTRSDDDERLYGERDIQAVIRAMSREPTKEMYDGEAHAGFDVSPTGGGDPKIIYIVKGKVVLPAFVSTEDNTVKVAEWAVNILKSHNVAPRNCRIDNGGAGKPIIDMMETIYGYRGVDRYQNNHVPRFSADFADRASEDAYGVKQLFNEVDLCLPKDDKLLGEMKTRKVLSNFNEHGKVKLQRKKDHRNDNGGMSPDRLDTLTMALAGRIKYGLARYAPAAKLLDPEYDEKAMRGKHFAEKRQQDENARRLGMFSWGQKAAPLIRRA